ALGYLLYSQLIALGKDLPMIGRKLNQMLNAAHDFISEHFQLPVAKQKEYLQTQIAGLSDLSGKLIGDVFRSILSFLAHVLIITAYSVLLLIYRRRIKNFILSLVVYYAGNERLREARDIVDQTAAVASSYLTGVFSVALIFSVINTV